MNSPRLVPLVALVAVLHGPSTCPVAAAAPFNDRFHWYAVPITVTGLPPRGGTVPVETQIQFSNFTGAAAGLVDERTLRLYRLDNARELEEPFQFTAAPQPRPKARPAPPGTNPAVSYLGEYPAGTIPSHATVAGELAWLIRSPGTNVCRYRLEFGIPRGGSLVQVPFPPQNFRGFDDQGRATPIRWFPEMQFHPQWPLDGAVHVYENRQLVTSYHVGPSLNETNFPFRFRRPFLYPVNGPGGVPLTAFGKPHDPTGSHAHHYSLWIAHNSVGGKEFWSENGGVIVHDGFEAMEDGPIFGRLVQKTRWRFGTTDLLREERRLTFHKAAEGNRLLDVDLAFSPAGTEPVLLGKTTFGFLAVRVAQSMTVFDGGGEITNSNGDRNEKAVHLSRARWLDQSGPMAPDAWAGIAMLDHPANPNSPTGWHCRNDGWAGAAFNMEAPYPLEPGRSLRLRYRLILHKGSAAEASIERYFEDYAAKPTVAIGKVIPRTP